MHLNLPASAHLVGICGAGMKALTELLLDRGWTLSGSDLLPANRSIQILFKKGVKFRQGHRESNVSESANWLIYSPAIRVNNCERRVAELRGIPQLSYGQMIGRLMRESTGVCLSGTHGKSTTSAMTARILQSAGRLNGAVVGAELCDTGRNGWSDSGDLFVAESCEFQGSFLEFSPRYTTILNVEADHFDCYPDLKSVEGAFREFADRTNDDGLLFFNADCGSSERVARTSKTRAKRASFGTSAKSDWSILDLSRTNLGHRFTVTHFGQPIAEIELSIHGRHNVINALAAAALCSEIGVSWQAIRETLAEFHGIRRRLEFVSEWRGATWIDDYAHHPTAVQTTLQTIRELFPSQRIRCVFQPHQILRTTSLMTEFAASFSAADDVLIAPIFAARESVSDQPILVSQELARQISENGVGAKSFSSLDQIVGTLEDSVRPNDVIVTMGAGDIDRIYHELTQRIQ